MTTSVPLYAGNHPIVVPFGKRLIIADNRSLFMYKRWETALPAAATAISTLNDSILVACGDAVLQYDASGQQTNAFDSGFAEEIKGILALNDTDILIAGESAVSFFKNGRELGYVILPSSYRTMIGLRGNLLADYAIGCADGAILFCKGTSAVFRFESQQGITTLALISAPFEKSEPDLLAYGTDEGRIGLLDGVNLLWENQTLRSKIIGLVSSNNSCVFACESGQFGRLNIDRSGLSIFATDNINGECLTTMAVNAQGIFLATFSGKVFGLKEKSNSEDPRLDAIRILETELAGPLNQPIKPNSFEVRVVRPGIADEHDTIAVLVNLTDPDEENTVVLSVAHFAQDCTCMKFLKLGETGSKFIGTETPGGVLANGQGSRVLIIYRVQEILCCNSINVTVLGRNAGSFQTLAIPKLPWQRRVQCSTSCSLPISLSATGMFTQAQASIWLTEFFGNLPRGRAEFICSKKGIRTQLEILENVVRLESESQTVVTAVGNRLLQVSGVTCKQLTSGDVPERDENFVGTLKKYRELDPEWWNEWFEDENQLLLSLGS